MMYQKENFNGECDFRSRFHNGWSMPENLHEYSEILYCKQGKGMVTVNGHKIPLCEKQLVWIPPNYIHGYEFADAEVICAVFSNDLIPLYSKASSGRYYCVSAIDMYELSEVLENLYQLNGKDYLVISGYLNLICAKVIEQSNFSSVRHTDSVLYQKIISYISKHYAENITLSQTAKKFGYNEKYLSHTLYELTGIRFRRLVSFYRINCAKNFLVKEELNITDIAAKSGFSALNTFNRTFKEMTGVTPTNYRQRYVK